ncbi:MULTISPECIES: phosphate ABC transporter permease subunit PstC [Sinorhizobium]|uniref:Phosphate transport system permease protein n=1 Tax=Sinorhizobium psoraleae TaxID=520838 RepID=A0ABT4KEP4_9HYPH|nr:MULTISPECIES: phosphate ABC transporter permease subunit PstC [Sinorhizobium]MCZ4090439.1 phosphate ABC transporter permease subunit PstC [Sinorhizobium psoraleae]MDK1384233.1 phosphate ABC transporter permease subunit PstC [Sinorhizobium sp. 7-81]NRP71814.1 Phosphate transport system permease protein PstC 1 [Sinorhizobium psoraleae]
MSTSLLLLIIVLIGFIAYFAGRARSLAQSGGKFADLHSLPGYHGSYVAIWAMLPAALVLATWLIASPLYIDSSVRSALPEAVKSQGAATVQLALGQVKSVAGGLVRLDASELAALENGSANLRETLAAKGVALAGEGEPYMIGAAQQFNAMRTYSRWLMSAVVLFVAVAGGVYAIRNISTRFRARNRVERVMLASLIVASSIAILTTIGIVASMLSEAGRFFSMVSPAEFFFGTVWDPRFAAAGSGGASGQFGLLPLLGGTLYIALVAMLFAVPIGLFAAIYMAEYASPRLRSTAKPLLEVLAGIPTIVYGFFALVTVGPFLRDISTQLNGLLTGNYQNFIQAQSVLTAGIVMGIMLIPFVSSLSDDIITQVPRALRDGSLGLGATRSETVKKVILPAALPGIVGALLLTASRAVGETMIVVLAAGVAARMQLTPFEPMTTVTVKIVHQLTGDLEFTSPQTLVAFALGITLFVITLCLNIYALYIVRKYREQYE